MDTFKIKCSKRKWQVKRKYRINTDALDPKEEPCQKKVQKAGKAG